MDIARRKKVARDRAGRCDVDFHAIQGGNVESRHRRRRFRRRWQPLNRPRLLFRLLLIHFGAFSWPVRANALPRVSRERAALNTTVLGAPMRRAMHFLSVVAPLGRVVRIKDRPKLCDDRERESFTTTRHDL